MSTHVQLFIALAVVFFLIAFPPLSTRTETSLTVKILNPTPHSVALCWLSSYSRESEVVRNSPEGCYRVGEGVSNVFTLNTYTGHRFILLPWDKTTATTALTHATTASDTSDGASDGASDETFATATDITTTVGDDESGVSGVSDATTPPLVNEGVSDATGTIPTRFLFIKPDMHSYEVDFTTPMSVSECVSIGVGECVRALLVDITSVDDVWQHLLRHRHYCMMLVVSVMLLSTWSIHTPSCTHTLTRKSSGSSSVSSVRQIKALKKSSASGSASECVSECASRASLLIPRHSLKCFAVLNMLLNHVSYALLESKSTTQTLGTLPADLIGSAQIFWFLVGYHHSHSHSPSVRSGTSTLLITFVLLEHFCRLPSPFTFETLMTVVVARALLTSKVFNFNGDSSEGQSSVFAELPLLIHAVMCSALIAVNNLFNASGLRLLQCTGILYAIAGRLFLTRSLSHSTNGRAAHYLWLAAAWGLQFKLVWTTKLSALVVDMTTLPVVCVAAVCVSGAVGQLVLFACPVSAPLWTPSSASVWVSRHSLEIYVFHFVALWYFFGL